MLQNKYTTNCGFISIYGNQFSGIWWKLQFHGCISSPIIILFQYNMLSQFAFNEHLISWINLTKKFTKIGIQQILMKPQLSQYIAYYSQYFTHRIYKNNNLLFTEKFILIAFVLFYYIKTNTTSLNIWIQYEVDIVTISKPLFQMKNTMSWSHKTLEINFWSQFYFSTICFSY